jgi:hypothetical protein
MAITIYGGTTIQPLEANVSASQQQTTFVFLSSDSGSYIYSGSNPNLIASGSPLPHHTSSLTFEDSGSTYSFVFSGSGFGGSPSSSLPGTTLSASIDGLTNSGSIAAAFTASVVAATNMTASIVSGSIVTLINSAYSSSATTTSSFSPNTLFTFTSQSGHPSGYLSGSDTTGSLTVTGSVSISGSITLNNITINPVSIATTNIPSVDVLHGNVSPVPLGLNIPAGKTPIILNAFQILTGVGTPYATNLSSSLRSSGSTDDLFILNTLDDSAVNEYRFVPQSAYNAIASCDIVWKVLDGNPTAGDGNVIIITVYSLY